MVEPTQNGVGIINQKEGSTKVSGERTTIETLGPQ